MSYLRGVNSLPMVFLLSLMVLFLACGEEKDETGDDSQAGLPGRSAPSDNEEPFLGDDDDAGDEGGLSFDPDYERELLWRFSPLIMQKLPDETPDYPIDSDYMGRMLLWEGGAYWEYKADVDTTRQIVFTLARKALIHQTYHYQLVYAFFYPRRPIPADGFLGFWERYLDSGLIDGKVIRLTLDVADETVLFVEVVRNSGDDWRLFVTQTVDDAARSEFESAGLTYPGIEKTDAPDDEDYVRLMPDDVPGAPARVVVAAQDGWTSAPHKTLGAFTSYEQEYFSGIEMSRGVIYAPDDQDIYIFDDRGLLFDPYSRDAYEALYAMTPEGCDYEMGIFDMFGYIWNAYTPWNKFLLDLDLASSFPGTPIDVEYMRIVQERFDFWDPALYDAFVYLPQSQFDWGEP